MGWIKDKVFQTGEDFVEWLDKEFGEYVKKHISSLDVHHTWKPNHSNYPKYTTLQLHKNMRNYHVNTRGWNDIGQHTTIGREGNVVLGLPIHLPPASAFGHNGNSNWHPFMFEMIGNFDKGGDKLQGAQLETVLAISRYFHKVKGKPIRFHRELDGRKSCPGTGLDKAEFMKWVNANPKKEEPFMLEKAVVIFGEADYATGKRLGEKIGAPVFTRAQAESFQVAKKIYVVGGTKENLKGNDFVVLSGNDFFETAAAVKKHLG